MLKREKAFRAVNHAAVGILLVCVCLLATSTVQGQAKPPILSEKDISAFSKSAIADLEKTASGSDKASAKLARNRLIAIGVEQIDAAFNDYRTKSRKRADTLNFLFDFLEIGAASAVSFTKGGLRAKSLIGEGLSLFKNARGAFNKDFKFLERQLLFDKMVAKRSKTLKGIYDKVNSDVDVYPWEQARGELRDYFYAGTIDEALSSLSVDTGAEASVALVALDKAKKDAGIKGQVTKVETEADAAITPLFDALVKSQDLAKIKAVYASAQKDPILEPLIIGLPQDPQITVAYKPVVEASLKAISNDTAKFEDYNRVLANLRVIVMRMIPDDPKPAAAFIKILGGK